MEQPKNWEISFDKKEKLIKLLTEQLAPLRAKVGISQGELASIIGVSRQTYCAMESGKRLMSWNTYLSLILFFDYNYATHLLIRQMEAFPNELIKQFNNGNIFLSDNHTAYEDKKSETSIMLSALDEQGLHTVKTVLKMEYDRCSKRDKND